MSDRHDRSSGSPAPSSAVPTASDPTLRPEADPLSEVLRAVRLTGSLFFLVDAACPYAVEAPSSRELAPVVLPGAQHIVSFHVVTRGHCWCRVEDSAPVLLEEGDVLVIPHGHRYLLANPRDLPSAVPVDEVLAWFEQMAAGKLPYRVEEGGADAESFGLICGFLGCDRAPFNPVLSALPRELYLRRGSGGGGELLPRLIDLALAESLAPRAGSDSVRLRLAELMFVELVRRHLTNLPTDQSGWFAGLLDPAVGRALRLLHQRPAAAWSLELLAREAGLSRSVLAERFLRFVGRPPMQYLLHWRMQLAARILADSSAKIAAVAQRVGYDSEAAFSRAFKRVAGLSPSEWRRADASKRSAIRSIP